MRRERLSNKERTIRWFVRYIDRTWKNKLAAIALVICGAAPMMLDGDATAFVFMLMFAIPLFFTTKRVIN